ncbi:hypothetical protein HFO60_04680 [Rhizobium leguminosarum]|uniref:hypothetical protein n=1 Tax=Rhizobium leguminosarum TaxID=384 RepID=UPI001C9797C8|nr:hypothetical protein [Rhizobium leguminosarum]MBY5539342.1 hypothetical protein [Rhizobium leguminosarum]
MVAQIRHITIAQNMPIIASTRDIRLPFRISPPLHCANKPVSASSNDSHCTNPSCIIFSVTMKSIILNIATAFFDA